MLKSQKTARTSLPADAERTLDDIVKRKEQKADLDEVDPAEEVLLSLRLSIQWCNMRLV
jgi:hypothetical protein